MPARIFAPLVLCALVFTGCDFIDEIQEEPAVPVTISSITVQDLPERRWDNDGTGPDLFLEVQDPGGGDYLQSEVVQDVDLSQPLTFTFSDSFEVATSTSRISIVVFDDDGEGRFTAELVGASESFTAEDVAAADGSFVLESLYADLGRVSTYTVVK
ncbi:hypothetical protein [Rubricoccus marinus]|uniref:Uncharacterized protein n=1 Tax=Rubricoccus marinus TaxID=716817 RepID=A0A259U0V8_9BACT|nr:hypothetical protein [Rubricoccus marinus]OZC03663.1 hypothetical protein BSZ36_12140 [Rubricoccus marinus]